METGLREPAQNRAAEAVLLVAVVASSEEDRAALSTAFTAHRGHRVSCSCPIDAATAVLDGQAPVDAIIGFVDDQNGWRQFQTLTSRFPHVLSVLIVSDPERLDARADGRILNALVELPREELAHRAARITAQVAEANGLERSTQAQSREHDQRRLAALSERERDILALTASGLAIKEIAQRINRSYSTIASHRNRIMEKLGLHDKVALTRFAIRVGLIEP